jgi:hypothetical protein
VIFPDARKPSTPAGNQRHVRPHAERARRGKANRLGPGLAAASAWPQNSTMTLIASRSLSRGNRRAPRRAGWRDRTRGRPGYGLVTSGSSSSM